MSLQAKADLIQCQRHHIKITKLNISQDCNFNKRALCSDCLHADNILKISAIEEIINNKKTEIFTQLTQQRRQLEAFITNIQLFTTTIQKYFMKELDKLQQYYNDQLFQNYILNDQTNVSLLQQLAEELSGRINKFQNLQVTPGNHNSINNVSKIIEKFHNQLQESLKQFTIEEQIDEKKTIKLEEAHSHQTAIKNIHYLLANQNLLIISGEGADKIQIYQHDQVWKQIDVIECKNIYCIDVHPSFKELICSTMISTTIDIWTYDDQNSSLFSQSQKSHFSKSFDWKISKQLNSQQFELTRVKYSRDGNLIAICGEDLIIQIWKNYKLLQELPKLQIKKIRSLDFNHDSSILISGSWDESIVIWIQTQMLWQPKQIIENAHNSYINMLTFMEDQNVFASCSDDKSIKIWDQSEDQTFICKQIIIGHTDLVTCVCFNREGNQLISGSFDKQVRVWQKVEDDNYELMIKTTTESKIKSITLFNKDILCGDIAHQFREYHFKN